jgi:ATP-dependent 26S proteasome regulatory subunit
MSIMNYIKAGYPLLWVDTFEEDRILTGYTAEITKPFKNGAVYKTYSWDAADGIRALEIENGQMAYGKSMLKKDPDNEDKEVLRNGIFEALLFMEKEAKENTVMFLKDYHPYLSSSFEHSPIIIRKIRNLLTSFKATGKTLIIISSKVTIPDELEKEITVVREALPDRTSLRISLKGTCESAGVKYPQNDESIIDAALGMTVMEAESSFSISLVENNGVPDAAIIRREKASIVRKTNLLEVIETTEDVNSIGGNDNLKEWLLGHRNSFTEEARLYGVTPPKGMLLVGVPGCGKSLAAKATATILGWPLLRLDIGKIFDKYQGESESKLRRVLAMVSSISPTVLWIDELEKAFSGTGGGDTDGHGTTKRVFSDFLYWLEERKGNVFVVATGNNVMSLPEELIRPGRIDIMWWIDVPDDTQRLEIIDIHLKKKGRTIAQLGKDIKSLVELSTNFSGAGLERWVKASIDHAFLTKKKDVDLEDFKATVSEITVAAVNSQNMKQSRAWAEANKCKMASKPHTAEDFKKTVEKVRKINLN